VIWVSAKGKYFCEQDWTAQISLNRLNNFAVARKSPGRSSRLPGRRWRDDPAAGAGFDLPGGSGGSLQVRRFCLNANGRLHDVHDRWFVRRRPHQSTHEVYCI
jgi:hypothetical protein